MTANASFLFFSGGVRAKVLCPASPGKIYGQLILGRHSVTADVCFFPAGRALKISAGGRPRKDMRSIDTGEAFCDC